MSKIAINSHVFSFSVCKSTANHPTVFGFIENRLEVRHHVQVSHEQNPANVSRSRRFEDV